MSTVKKAFKAYSKVKKVAKILKSGMGISKKGRRYRRNVPALYASSMTPVMFRNSVEVGIAGNSTGTSGTGYGRNFKADDISDITDIMNLFDLYQIYSIDIRYIPGICTADGSGAWHAPMYVAFDPISSSAPASSAEMLNYANVKKKDPYKEWKMTITPHFFQSIGVLSSNEYTSAPSTRFWMTNTDTVCYGLKVWFDPVNINSAQLGTFIFTYNILAKFQS